MADEDQDDKQHEPSQKKLDDARKKGDVPRSQDVTSAVSYATLLMPLVAVPTAALLAGESITAPLVIGGVIILGGVYIGAFLRRPRRWSASSAPECLPVDGCPEVGPSFTRRGSTMRRSRQG